LEILCRLEILYSFFLLSIDIGEVLSLLFLRLSSGVTTRRID
jgi:hypothetical protein